MSPGLEVADDGDAVADEDVVYLIAEGPPMLPGARYHGRRWNRNVDDAHARTGHVSEIEAVAVDEEIVDPSPAGLLEPRELGRVFRVGDVEDQQAEVGVLRLYSDYRQTARDLDVQRRSGGLDLGCLAHVGRVGDVDDVDEAAKVPHQRVVPREIEVGPVREPPFPGKGDKDDLADAFHVEAVGGIVGGKDGERCFLSGGGGGKEEDQQRDRRPACGRDGLFGVHG